MDYFNKKEENLDEETYELYDRNIRLWGKENQIKLNQSYVLLINLNGIVTELAKNLVLAGVNLRLYDREENETPHLVDLNDLRSNFYLDEGDLNKERVKVLQEKLSHINSYVKVEEVESLENFESVCVQSACLGFKNFVTKDYEDLFTKNKIPLFVVNTSGFYGFFYNNVCKNSNENDSDVTPRTRRINNFSFNDNLMLLLDKMNKVKTKRCKAKLYLAISVCLMEFLEKRITNDEMVEIQENAHLLEKYLDNDSSGVITKDQNFLEVFRKLLANLKTEFNPVCAVLAGLVSQEIFNVLTNPKDVNAGLYTYDGENQSGNFHN